MIWMAKGHPKVRKGCQLFRGYQIGILRSRRPSVRYSLYVKQSKGSDLIGTESKRPSNVRLLLQDNWIERKVRSSCFQEGLACNKASRAGTYNDNLHWSQTLVRSVSTDVSERCKEVTTRAIYFRSCVNVQLKGVLTDLRTFSWCMSCYRRSCKHALFLKARM